MTTLLLVVSISVFVTILAVVGAFCVIDKGLPHHNAVKIYRDFLQDAWKKLTPLGRCTILPIAYVFFGVALILLYSFFFLACSIFALFIRREKDED